MILVSKTSIKYKDTTFYGLFSTKGIGYFLNWSLFWAVLITLGINFTLWKYGDYHGDVSKIGFALNEPLLGASAGIFGIVIAALTLTLTLFHQSLLPIMLEKKLLQRYLFPFWKAVGLWGISILLCFLQIIIENIGIFSKVNFYLTIVEIFIFLYSTFYTVKLTGLVIQLALQRAQINK